MLKHVAAGLFKAEGIYPMAKLSYRTREAAGWLLLLFSLAAMAGFIFLIINACLFGGISEIGIAMAGLAFAVMGRILTHYRAENRLSWLMAWIGAGLPFMVLLNSYVPCAATGALTLPFPNLAITLSQIAPFLVIPPLFILLPALFPDGHFLSPAWRRLFTFCLFLLAIFVVGLLFSPGPLDNYLEYFDLVIKNPLGLAWPWMVRIAPIVYPALALIMTLGALLAVLSFILRFRRSTGETRQQFKWFAAFLATVIVVYIIGFELLGTFFYPEIFDHWSYGLILMLAFGGFPVVIGIIIFKYRLYDIDIIIRRTLVYSLVTLALLAVYFGSVVLLQRLFTGISGQQSPLAIVISTLLIAVLFNPLRQRVQDIIDRRFYRKKYDAQQVLEQFAQTARDETDREVLTAELVQVVQETMQPERVVLWLKK